MGALKQGDYILERRRAVRRSAWILGVVALSFYVAFIVMSVARS
jgi:hypothetical protein